PGRDPPIRQRVIDSDLDRRRPNDIQYECFARSSSLTAQARSEMRSAVARLPHLLSQTASIRRRVASSALVAHATIGQAAAQPTAAMNSRRLIAVPLSFRGVIVSDQAVTSALDQKRT